jgi:hypothetical protein
MDVNSETLAGIVDTEQMAQYTDTAIEMAMMYGPRLILAIIVLLVGLWIINRLVRVMAKGMEQAKTEPTLARFFQNLVSIGLKALLLISVASMIGIETTSFIAVLAAGGLAVGLALQGSLANFAGGVLVLLFRPYRVGDYIEAQGVGGTVKEIQIFNTVINTRTTSASSSPTARSPTASSPTILPSPSAASTSCSASATATTSPGRRTSSGAWSGPTNACTATPSPPSSSAISGTARWTSPFGSGAKPPTTGG